MVARQMRVLRLSQLSQFYPQRYTKANVVTAFDFDDDHGAIAEFRARYEDAFVDFVFASNTNYVADFAIGILQRF